MAARYWVGGTGNWSDAANHWSDTSGGAPGAGFLPTSADDVYFDSNSFSANGSITITAESYCKDMDWSLIDQSVTFYNNQLNGTYYGYYMNIYGSLILSTLLTINWEGNVRASIFFRATSAVNITSNGAQLRIYNVVFDGVGGIWTLTDNLYVCPQSYNSNGGMSLANGELDLNGYELSIRSLQCYAGNKTLTFNGGTLKCNNFSNTGTGTYTINYDTGTLHFGGSYSMGITVTVQATYTFYNVFIEGLYASTYQSSPTFSLGTNIAVTNQLSLIGEDSTKGRLFIYPGINRYGVRQSFTAENVTAENCDFYNIIGLGNANWDLSAIPGGAGDGGGNQNIIFTAPKTSYWFSDSGNWSDITKWYSLTNGGGTNNRIPMIHDILIFDSNSLSEDSEVYLDMEGFGEWDASQVLYVLDFLLVGIYGASKKMFGSIYFNDYCTIEAINFELHGAGTYEIDIRDNQIMGMSEDSRGVWKLAHDISTGYGLTLRSGTFDMNDYNWICGSMSLQGTFYMRSGAIIMSESLAPQFTVSQANFQGSDGTLIIEPPTSAYDCDIYFGGGDEIKDFQIKGASTGFYRVRNQASTANTFYKMSINAGLKVSFQQACTFNIYEFIANGTSENPITITAHSFSGGLINPHILINKSTLDFIVAYCDISWSAVSGTPKIKTILGKTWATMSKTMGIAKASIKRIMGIYVNSAWIATNSTDSGNNTGWNITP